VHSATSAPLVTLQITCQDRRGLLGDVVLALSQLPLIIISTAVTATTEGIVSDVFEVRHRNVLLMSKRMYISAVAVLRCMFGDDGVGAAATGHLHHGRDGHHRGYRVRLCVPRCDIPVFVHTLCNYTRVCCVCDATMAISQL
jgi:hypothetical protein